MPRHPFRAWTLGIGAGILLAAAATAQEPSRNAPQPGAGQAPAQPSAEPLATVELERLLDLVTASSGKQFLVEARVGRHINVRGDRVPTDLTYPALLSILRNNGYAGVEIEGFVNIVPAANIRQYPLPIVRGEERNRPADEYVTTIMETAVVEAPTLVPLLRAMISTEGHLAATPGNQLIVVDRYANVRRIAAIVEELDR